MEELLIDYRDFLRTHSLEEWPTDHRYAQRLRELMRQKILAMKHLEKASKILIRQYVQMLL